MAGQAAKLALEDGTIYTGRAFGAGGETFGEVVFNTSMTGYQEVLTDPSYKGQIVSITYPLIGNYGINADDRESPRPQVEGFLVRELARLPSNFRSQGRLEDYLREYNVLGLEGIDTRTLVVLALLLWSVGSSLAVYPHSLSYFNERGSGPDNGHRCQLDSNIDFVGRWGWCLSPSRRSHEAGPSSSSTTCGRFRVLRSKIKSS